MKGDAMADGMCGGHVAKERLALFLQNNCLPNEKVTVETAAHTDCAAPSRRVSVCVHCVSGCVACRVGVCTPTTVLRVARLVYFQVPDGRRTLRQRIRRERQSAAAITH